MSYYEDQIRKKRLGVELPTTKNRPGTYNSSIRLNQSELNEIEQHTVNDFLSRLPVNNSVRA